MADKKVLNDILQGLVTTDQKVIEKINTDVAELEDKVSRGSGSYGLADINSPSVTSNGELIAEVAASIALPSPEPRPIPISAEPDDSITALTSAKSTLISPGTVMISEIP